MNEIIYFLIEGNDDERFFNEVIKPKLNSNYATIAFYKYACEKKDRVCKLINNIDSMGADHLCFSDLDSKQCVTHKKEELISKYNNIESSSIIIVIKEIESWYLAGLSDEKLRKYKIKPLSSTNGITKEMFEELIPKSFDSRKDFMIEILKDYSIEIAKQKNRSFNYFIEKFNSQGLLI